MGPGQSRRGHAAPRPWRRARRDDAQLPRLGRRRRVQRRARPQALLRPEVGGGDRAGRQPRRPPRRGPDVPGWRRSNRPLGEGRRRRPDRAQRAQLHRTRLRRAGGAGLLGPRPHGDLAAEAGRDRLGRRSSASEGARWFHTGGIFAALSETTPLVAKEAMQAARRHGAIISYDLNYRASLWKSIGGQKRAQRGQPRAGARTST